MTSEETTLETYHEGVGVVHCTVLRNDTSPSSIPFFNHDTLGMLCS